MQIYFGGYCLYSFDQQRMFVAEYMAKNSLVCVKAGILDINNMITYYNCRHDAHHDWINTLA